MLARGAGAVVAAGAAVAGVTWLRDGSGDGRGDGNGAGDGSGGLSGRSKPVPRLKNYFASIDLSASNPRISVATGDAFNMEKLVRAAVGGLDQTLGIRRFISKGDVVLIKPNVGFDRAPHLGATTNPEVVRWLIRLCREAGAREVVVTDNPIESPEVCFARSGIGEVARQEGARVMLPSAAGFEQLVIRDRRPDPIRGEALAGWPVFYRPLAESTKVIGVAPIKDHNLCSASMNLKNWYGLLGGRRNQFHQAIHEVVSDLGMMMSPTLVIADGTRVMMRNGPTGGRMSDVRAGGEIGRPTVVASVDPVACDAWCYRHMLGRDPARLAYLALAERKIAEQVARGVKRLGVADWQGYEHAGLVAKANV